MDRKAGREAATKAAYESYGRDYRWWFVWGPLAVKLMLLVIPVVLLFGGIMWLGDNMGAILAWLDVWIRPAIAAAVATSVIGIGAFVFWRVMGWQLEVRGLNVRVYTVCVMFVAVLMALLTVGVAA